MELVLLNLDVVLANPIDLQPTQIIAQSMHIWGFAGMVMVDLAQNVSVIQVMPIPVAPSRVHQAVASRVPIIMIQKIRVLKANGNVKNQVRRPGVKLLPVVPVMTKRMIAQAVCLIIKSVTKMEDAGNEEIKIMLIFLNALVPGVKIHVVRAVLFLPLAKRDLFRLTINGICLESLPYYTDQDGSVKAPVKPYQIPVNIFQENAIPTTMRIRKNVLVATGKWMA